MTQQVGGGRAELRALVRIAPIAFVAAAVVAFTVSSGQPKTFEAGATLTEPSIDRSILLEGDVATATRQRMGIYASVAKSVPVLRTVIDRLDLDASPNRLAREIETEITSDGSVLEIRVAGPDAAFVAALANSIALEVIDITSSDPSSGGSLFREIDAELAVRSDRLEALQARVERLDSIDDPSRGQRRRLRRLTRRLEAAPASYARLVPFSSAAASAELSLLEAAIAPTTPTTPQPFTDAILAGLVATFFVLPLAFAPHFLADAIRDRDDVLAETGLPTIAVVPRVDDDLRRPERFRRPLIEAPRSAASDAYRAAALGLRLGMSGDGCQIVSIMATRRDDAKSAVATNVAVALAAAGLRVVLLDADLDAPHTQRMLDIDAGVGLADALAGEIHPAGALVTTVVPGMRLLPAGDPSRHPAEHVGSVAMRRVLGQLGAANDFIIIDGPPMRDSAAAAILGPLSDGVVLTIPAGRARRAETRESTTTLYAAGARIVGAILVHEPPRQPAVIARLADRGGGRFDRHEQVAAPSWGAPGSWQIDDSRRPQELSRDRRFDESDSPSGSSRPLPGPFYIPPESPSSTGSRGVRSPGRGGGVGPPMT